MICGDSFDEDKSDLSESSSGASFDGQENSSDEVHKNGSDNVTDQDFNDDMLDEKEYKEESGKKNGNRSNVTFIF